MIMLLQLYKVSGAMCVMSFPGHPIRKAAKAQNKIISSS